MAIACSKCKAETSKMTCMAEGGNGYAFCPLCTDILEGDKCETHHVMTFMENDESFEMTQVQRNMLNARLMRAEGKGVWSVAVKCQSQHNTE